MNLRVSVITPRVELCDCKKNTNKILALIKNEYGKGSRLFVTQEMAVTGLSIGDYIYQSAILKAAAAQLNRVVFESEKMYDATVVLGLPCLFKGNDASLATCKNLYEEEGLFVQSALAVIKNGKILSCIKMPEDKIVDIGGIRISFSSDVLDAGGEEKKSRSDYDIRVSPGAGEPAAGCIYSGLKEIFDNKRGVVYRKFSESEYLSETMELDADLDIISSEGDCLLKPPEYVKSISYEKKPFLKETLGLEESVSRRAFEIQRAALAQKLNNTGFRDVVIGLSGGLDSTLALAAAYVTFSSLGIEKERIHAISMPCFGTSKRTKNNACRLADILGVSFEEISIEKAVNVHLNDISHPQTEGIYHADVVFENAQARERTQVLMDKANAVSGLVIGTGDMSEIALGWNTYNGDHMSMYSVNAGIPKTVIPHILRQFLKLFDNGEILIDENRKKALKDVVEDIIATPISPELKPQKGEELSQKTEDEIGPYELHDFFLFYFVKYGSSPCRLYKIACDLFACYNPKEILRWEKVFYSRFIKNQFKRNCMPESPLIFDFDLSAAMFKAPSEASTYHFLEELDEL